MRCSSVPRAMATGWPGSWRGLGCSCSSASAIAVGDVLDQRAAERHRQKLLAAADAEHRHVARQRPVGERQFGGGAALLQGHRRVPVAVAVQRGIDVECAAGDDQRVDAVQVLRRQRCIVRQRDRQAAGCDDCVGIVLAHRIPGVFRVAARLLGIEGHADDGSLVHDAIASPPRRCRARAAAALAPSGTPISCAFSVSATIA